MKKINCKYYCEDYSLKGMCKLYSNWSDPMPIIAYCIGEHCKEREFITNFDRIKKASKEELAEIFMDREFTIKVDCNSGNYRGDKEDWLEWMDSEVETKQND